MVLGAAGLMMVGAGCNPFAKMQERVAQNVIENVVENQIKKETGKDVNIDLNGKNLTVTGADGEGMFTAGEDVKLPSDFPKSVPIYGGATIKSVVTVPGEEGANVVLETSDSPTTVRDWYKKEAEAKGWKQTAALDLEGDSHMLAFDREENGATWAMTASISSKSEDGKTGIFLVYSKK